MKNVLSQIIISKTAKNTLWCLFPLSELANKPSIFDIEAERATKDEDAADGALVRCA